METKDKVFALRDGFYCVVNRRVYGPWPLIEYARAGLQTEQRREAKRISDREANITETPYRSDWSGNTNRA